jgi:hypothetical protein
MKKFIILSISYIFIVALIAGIAISGTFLIISKASFKLPLDKTMLVLGDSQTEVAIDDTIFSHSVNVSQGANAYYYSYIKLKRFFKENDHIQTVLLSFNCRAISKQVDTDWMFNQEFLSTRLPGYIPLMDIDDMLFYKDNKTFRMSFLQLPVGNVLSVLKWLRNKKLAYYEIGNDIGIGGYDKLDKSNLEQAVSQGGRYVVTDISSHQLDYLRKIIDLCTEKGVELFLITGPLYNAAEYWDMDTLKEYYDTYLADIPYLDYSSFPLTDICYADLAHLNYKGAAVFSQFLEDNYEDIFVKYNNSEGNNGD